MGQEKGTEEANRFDFLPRVVFLNNMSHICAGLFKSLSKLLLSSLGIFTENRFGRRMTQRSNISSGLWKKMFALVPSYISKQTPQFVFRNTVQHLPPPLLPTRYFALLSINAAHSHKFIKTADLKYYVKIIFKFVGAASPNPWYLLLGGEPCTY